MTNSKSSTAKPPTIHARIMWCPNGCSFEKPLIKKNVSLTHAEKGCSFCKRKFTYVRTDTKEGRNLRTKLWQASKKAAEVPVTEPVTKKVALTSAQRQAKYRHEKMIKEAAAQMRADMNGEIQG